MMKGWLHRPVGPKQLLLLFICPGILLTAILLVFGDFAAMEGNMFSLCYGTAAKVGCDYFEPEADAREPAKAKVKAKYWTQRPFRHPSIIFEGPRTGDRALATCCIKDPSGRVLFEKPLGLGCVAKSKNEL